MVSVPVKDYVKKNFPGEIITKIERGRSGVEVELSSIPADVSALMEAGKTNTLPNTLYSTPSMASDVQAMLAGDKTPKDVLAGYDTDWDTYAKEAGNPDWGY